MFPWGPNEIKRRTFSYLGERIRGLQFTGRLAALLGRAPASSE